MERTIDGPTDTQTERQRDQPTDKLTDRTERWTDGKSDLLMIQLEPQKAAAPIGSEFDSTQPSLFCPFFVSCMEEIFRHYCVVHGELPLR